MKIDDISITRSAVVPNNYILTIESRGHKATLHFENDLHHFASAVAAALKYFGQVWGLIKVEGEKVVKVKGNGG